MKRYKLFVLILSLVLAFLPLNVNTATTSRISLLAVEADEKDVPVSLVTPASSPMGQNVELVTQIGGPVYAVDLAWPYAYIGMGPRVVILNISNPAQPVMVGQSDVLPGIIRNIAVAGDYVYATAEYAGLWIIRAADRAHPEIVGSITTNRPTNGVTVSGNLVYTVGADFQIVDVSDPDSPQLRGSLSSKGGSDIAVAGDYAYVVSGHYLRIIHIVNPDAPVLVGQYSLPSGAMASGVAVDGNYAYIATGNRGLWIIDVSSPNNPVKAGSLTFSSWLYDVAVAGRYAYLANTDALRIVDVSQPSNPTLIGACSLPRGSASAVVLNGDYAYVGDQDGGLRIVRVSSPSSPVETGHYDTVGYVVGVGWKDNYLYTTSLFAPRETGVRIYQVSDPSRPIQVGTYAARPGFTILIEGKRAYLGGENRLTILDVSNPASPTLIGQTETLTNPVTSIFVTGNYAYLVIYGDGMCIVDISNPSHPIRRGCYHYPGMNDVVVDGNYAYLGGFGFLYVLDVSDPDAPVYCGRYEPRDTINAVAVREKNLYALSDTYIRVLDLTTPCTPTLRSIYSNIGGRDILFAGDLAYVPANHKGVRILNVSDPLNIVEIGFYDTPGWTDRIAVAGDYIYAADQEGGLLVLRTTLPITAVIPVDGGSFSSPDRTTLIFPPGAFTGTVVLTYTYRSPNDVPSLGNLVGTGHFFEITAVYSQTGQPAQLAPGKTFTMTVEYTESERGPAVEDTLALYWWNGSQWVREDSEVDPSRNMVIARPAHLSLWGVLGETRRVYLPVTMRY